MPVEKSDLAKFIVSEMRRQITDHGGFFSDGALDEDGDPTYPLIGIDGEIDVESLAQAILDRLSWEKFPTLDHRESSNDRGR